MNEKDVEIGKDLIQGHINLIILCLLMEKDRYGYEVYKEALARTGGRYELKEPSLYTAFRRLEGEKLIHSYWGDESQGGRRKYYRITPEGKAAYQQGLREWQLVKQILDTILGLV
ncbi:MAG: PadR family transcriptional regulator [Treponema sp.]|jgi:PadR family transcriptional regulator PadR|nr:PadR family transcriptional regulator [Treponema sp.]